MCKGFITCTPPPPPPKLQLSTHRTIWHLHSPVDALHHWSRNPTQKRAHHQTPSNHPVRTTTKWITLHQNEYFKHIYCTEFSVGYKLSNGLSIFWRRARIESSNTVPAFTHSTGPVNSAIDNLREFGRVWFGCLTRISFSIQTLLQFPQNRRPPKTSKLNFCRNFVS